MVHCSPLAGPDRDRTLTFSGDMGRRGHADPQADRRRSRRPTCWCAKAPTATACTARSTETVEKLYAAIRDTVDRGGKVLIPAFSLGRTQLIIHVLQQGLRERQASRRCRSTWTARWPPEVAGGVPGAPEQPLDRRSREAIEEGHGLLGGDGVNYVREFEESTRLASQAGLVRHHRVERHVRRRPHPAAPEDSSWTTRGARIILVSYQARGHDRPAAAGTEADGPVPGPGLEQVDRGASTSTASAATPTGTTSWRTWRRWSGRSARCG